MKKVAIKHAGTVVDADGHVTGHDAGATLVRRLLRVFPQSVVIGPGQMQFTVMPSRPSSTASERVSPVTPASRIASISRSGMPHRPKPPAHSVMPSNSSPSSAAAALG